MELEYIKEFVMLAHIRKYTDAADAMFVSQSTLTRHIKKLEADLHQELFERTTRNLKLTPFGRFFLPYAQEMVCVLTEFENDRYEIAEESYEKLRIRTIPVAYAYQLNRLFTRFTEEYPHIQLQIRDVYNNEDIRELLLNKEADLVFYHEYHPKDDLLEVIPLTESRLTIAVPEKHFLASRMSLTFRDLAGVPLITYHLKTGIMEYCMEQFRSLGIAPNIRNTCMGDSNILSYVEAGAGVGILCRNTLAYSPVPDNVCLVDLEAEQGMQLVLAYAREIQLTSAMKKFIRLCRLQFAANAIPKE